MLRLREVLLVVVISVPMTGCGPRPPQVSPAAMEAQIEAAEQRLRQSQTADADNAQPIASRRRENEKKVSRQAAKSAKDECEKNVAEPKQFAADPASP